MKEKDLSIPGNCLLIYLELFLTLFFEGNIYVTPDVPVRRFASIATGASVPVYYYAVVLSMNSNWSFHYANVTLIYKKCFCL